MKWRTRHTALAAVLCSVVLSETPSTAEQIITEQPVYDASPGDALSVLFLLRDNQTPLYGYSLDIEVAPQIGASGSVQADVRTTDFFDARNLIAAGGAVRDPFFSLILGTEGGGVFITTNIAAGSPLVHAVNPVNDVLARVTFDVSADANGEFLIGLGQATALSDGDGLSVPFSFESTRIVVPEPTTLLTLFAGGIFLATVRRPTFRGRALGCTGAEVLIEPSRNRVFLPSGSPIKETSL